MANQQSYDMRDRTCLVTGATSGIGRETALDLVRSGGRVLIVARDRERGEAVRSELAGAAAPTGSVELFVADLASQRDVRDLAARVRLGHERLDVLVHNAGAVNRVRRVTADGIESGVVPSVVELRGGGPVSELSQTVEAATSGAAVAMVV